MSDIPQQIDWHKIQRIISQSAYVYAHNASFDESFLSTKINTYVDKWRCTIDYIPWAEKGHTSRSLTHLAADHGYLNPYSHRALPDCLTLFNLISHNWLELKDNSQYRYIPVIAKKNSFKHKDVLKSRGYRWDGDQKAWIKQVREDFAQTEREVLSALLN